MENTIFLELPNGGAADLSSVPCHEFAFFRRVLMDAVNNNQRISAFFAEAAGPGRHTLYAVLLNPALRKFEICSTVVGERYPALTPDIMALHWFEREIAEAGQLIPEGHPWLKPIRFAHSGQPGVTDYFTMLGDAAHEVAVGPVHAGVIEPGHFRFQCMGETVYSLEIELGYQHRGIEQLLVGGPDTRSVHWVETAAGDSSVAAALVYDALLEALTPGGRPEPALRGTLLRTLALEFERIANHTGDLGALAGDVAFLTSAAYCGRIRGEFLNMTAALCGNRFGRGLITPGGTAFDLEAAAVGPLKRWFEEAVRDLNRALDLLFDSPSVLDRFENTGFVSAEIARRIGAVGPAARASELNVDVRRDLGGIGFYDKLAWQVPVAGTGDVLARAKIRRDELAESVKMVRALLDMLSEAGAPALPVALPGRLRHDAIAVAATEAWRGELCCVALTGHDGRFRRYKIVDPSFHNWFALALALRNEQISNFPICNKSFNLSYCGHDL